MGSHRADFMGFNMLKSYGVSHSSLQAELPPCICNPIGSRLPPRIPDSLIVVSPNLPCTLFVIHPSIHLSSYPCIRSSIHESIHPAMHPCIHFINVRSLCMTYVAAGGWGGVDNNRTRTQPYKNATAKGKSDLTLP